MSIIEEIISNWRKTPRGPAPKIEEEDIATILRLLIEEETMGRYEMAKNTGINQGTIRGLMERMKQRRLIKTSRKGCRITMKGIEALNNYLRRRRIREIKILSKTEIWNLAPGENVAAVLVEGKFSNKIDGIKQRDEALKSGAEGATTLIVEEGEIKFPRTGEPIKKFYPREEAYLKMKMNPKNGQIIIICWGKTVAKAIKGAIKAAETLI
ncbi:MAG: DUF4443 domain-containing protein [archaeon GB-1845-036]|nr:DUF4443 domain-containing protein [Candidatus Culexmicrobium thermophilum]RLE54347.1 MAG: hypothetical protein DRJ30_05360 [Candidatus Verstraetearchaeota archaeon]HDO20315.1 DUF4443 domain-containing protein [Candidatus Bathyarchaeota archaeon]